MQRASNIILLSFNATAGFFHDLKKLFFTITGLTVAPATFILPGIWICKGKSVSWELPCRAAALFLYLAPGFWCQACGISSETPEGEVAERFSSNAEEPGLCRAMRILWSCPAVTRDLRNPAALTKNARVLSCPAGNAMAEQYGWARPGPKPTIPRAGVTTEGSAHVAS